MMERIAVFADVDGTMLRDDRKEITPAVSRAAHTLREHGVPLHPVTARSHATFHHLVSPLGVEGNLAALDGGATLVRATAAETSDTVWSQWVEGSAVRPIVQAIGDLSIKIFCDPTSQAQTAEEIALRLADASDLCTATPSIFASFDTEVGEQILERLAGVPGIEHTKIMGYKSRPERSCIQIVSPGVNKRAGIGKLIEFAGYEHVFKIGIGDGTNDHELFAACDFTIAMGNASPALKAEADHVAPHVNQDGFVEVLRYALNPNAI